MTTEVEARYVVTDRKILHDLRALSELAGYRLQPLGMAEVVDYYLDTAARSLLRQGWACRLRNEGDSWTLTLKAPKSWQGATLARSEWQEALPERVSDVALWPKGALRRQVRALIGDLPLAELLVIHQSRRRSAVMRGDRWVAELSLDRVTVSGDTLRQRIHMVECELAPDGDMDDLERIDRELVEVYGLEPEHRSKLQRALDLLASADAEAGVQEKPAAEVPISLDDLLARNQVHIAQAVHVANLADQLFEQLHPLHRLPASARSLVHMAALLAHVGAHIDRARRHEIARDILLRQPIAGLDAEQRRLLAAAAYLQRKRVNQERLERAFPLPVSPEERRQGLLIASLVRLATALDSSRTQSTQIERVELTEGGARIVLAGPQAALDRQRAVARADLWSSLVGSEPRWLLSSAESDGEAARSEVGLDAHDAMGVAAGKVLRYHLDDMLAHEAGTRAGLDPEELHDMRVATRRMRSALRFFGPYIQAQGVQAVGDGLRSLTRVLGAVRDRDVSLAAAQGYLLERDASEAARLEPLLTTWRAERERARADMLHYLGSEDYAWLVEAMQELVRALESGTDEAQHPVGDVGPRFLYVRWQVVRAYDHVLQGAPVGLLHALRIDCKHLRYGLEFLREILPPKTEKVIREVIALQDHLGDLHDAHVAAVQLASMALAAESKVAAAMQAYRQAKLQEMEALIETFPRAWRRFGRKKVRAALGEILPYDET